MLRPPHRLLAILGTAALLGGPTACADAVEDDGAMSEVAIEVAALSLGSLTNVVYVISVDGAAALTVDSDDYEVTNGEPDLIRYVAPCEISGGSGAITVTVQSLEMGGVALAAGALPPAQTRQYTCVDSQSVQANFSFFALASSQQGFFDISVGTDLVYCSAKLDCSEKSSFFDGGDGAVLGFACSGGNAGTTDTVLHMDDIVIDCGIGGSVTLVPDVAGNLPPGNITGTVGLLETSNVYRGAQTLSGVENVYWNVAIELSATALAETCTLTTTATATDGATVPVNAAFVSWSVPMTGGGGVICSAHPLSGTGPNAGVAPAWPTFDTAETFDNTFSGP